MVAAERLEKITGESQVVGDGFGDAGRIVDWPTSPFEASINVTPASSKIFFNSSGFFLYFSI